MYSPASVWATFVVPRLRPGLVCTSFILLLPFVDVCNKGWYNIHIKSPSQICANIGLNYPSCVDENKFSIWDLTSPGTCLLCYIRNPIIIFTVLDVVLFLHTANNEVFEYTKIMSQIWILRKLFLKFDLLWSMCGCYLNGMYCTCKCKLEVSGILEMRFSC